MNNMLIFDVGMHKCEDTDFYISLGYKVISIDADNELVRAAYLKYKNEVQSGQLQILNYAIADADDMQVSFNISNSTIWSSLKKEISDRNGSHKSEITVTTKSLKTLFDIYGVPLYCKIDIEGYDNVCLESLQSAKELPKYISVETECISEGQAQTDSDALQTLTSLQKLGYNKFKLVDQRTLEVLELNRKFYLKKDSFFDYLTRISKKISNSKTARQQYAQKLDYNFSYGASGPFGNSLPKSWMNFEEASEALLKHRKDYFQLSGVKEFSFWCDWHACRD